MSILKFYTADGQDNVGRTLKDIWDYDYHKLEYTHNFIQWLFPTNEISRFNPNAPVIFNQTAEQLRLSSIAQKNLHKSFSLMIDFYGFEIKKNDEIIFGDNFDEQAKNWINRGNHNYLRITRILKSLKLLGLEKQAIEFQKILQEVYELHPNKIGKRTLSFWKSAV